MEALIFGKPEAAAVSAKASTVRRRPRTARSPLPSSEAKLWMPVKKPSMLKKLPSKTNENGIVGKPAEPTVEPGGRPAAAVCDAGTPVAGGVAPAVVEVLDASVDEPDAWPAAATCATGGAAAGA